MESMENDAKNWLKSDQRTEITSTTCQPSKNGVFPEIHGSWGLGGEMLFKWFFPQKGVTFSLQPSRVHLERQVSYFFGNFTPKTSNYCLKNRALGFRGSYKWSVKTLRRYYVIDKLHAFRDAIKHLMLQ